MCYSVRLTLEEDAETNAGFQNTGPQLKLSLVDCVLSRTYNVLLNRAMDSDRMERRKLRPKFPFVSAPTNFLAVRKSLPC